MSSYLVVVVGDVSSYLVVGVGDVSSYLVVGVGVCLVTCQPLSAVR